MNELLNKKKINAKWAPIVESVGANPNRTEWMSEMAEFTYESLLKENQNALTNLNTIAGMGNVVSPGSPNVPGVPGRAGTDLATSLLATSMKIAAATIGLDLVTTVPSAGPVIDLPFLDEVYEDIPANSDIKQTLFQVGGPNLTDMKATLNSILSTAGVTKTSGGLSARVWLHFSGANLGGIAANDIAAVGSAYNALVEPSLIAGTGALGWVEFLGFSRINGLPMFRTYEQIFTASTNRTWIFDQKKNSFFNDNTLVEFIAGTSIDLPSTGSPSGTSDWGAVTANDVLPISAYEDNIPGFVSNWNSGTMPRGEDESVYPGNVSPSFSVKRLTVGTAKVSSALKLTEIEDVKAQTGIDLIQRQEAALANELAQKISREIVAKVRAMGDTNRATAPAGPASYTNISNPTVFDLDVDAYTTAAPGGETSHAIARQLFTKIGKASNYIAVEGRIGQADWIVTNWNIAEILKQNAAYTILPAGYKAEPKQLYPAGQLGNMMLYVDPYMGSENVIIVGRKTKKEEPGILFIPYIMAQSISIIAPQTYAPQLMLRSRYTVAEVGFYPHKQYMTIYVADTEGVLL